MGPPRVWCLYLGSAIFIGSRKKKVIARGKTRVPKKVGRPVKAGSLHGVYVQHFNFDDKDDGNGFKTSYIISMLRIGHVC